MKKSVTTRLLNDEDIHSNPGCGFLPTLSRLKIWDDEQKITQALENQRVRSRFAVRKSFYEC